jgi:hypothetical protein
VDTEAGERKSVSVTNALDLTVIELVRLRTVSPSVAWSGLLIAVSIDGQCRSQVNHDPGCFEDPTFFDD